ncbi:MAG: hypothetical protein QOG71_3510 [Pyrinomonadaceae bacterium]|nr:hypothetical protein [Pyrinomonadaceae bacterium]
MANHKGGYTYQDEKGAWWARITIKDESGKRRNLKRRAKDKTEAKQILRKLTRQLDDEGEKVITADQVTFDQLADYYAKRYLKPAEYRDERKTSGLRSLDRAQHAVVIFRQYFGGRKLRSITYGDLYAFKQRRLATPTQYTHPRTIASVNRELVVLRRILNIAVREGYLIKSPFNSGDSLISAADENKRERILSREEEIRLFAAIDAEPRREHLRGILLIALDCALRRGEIFTLCWSDVDLERRTITVRAFNCKTARSRTVAMTNRVYEDLQGRWLDSKQELGTLVFGIRVSIRASFGKACRAANIQDFHFHDCRHTAITRMIRAGLPPVEVMRVSGHSTLSCLYRYANLDNDTVFRAAAALDVYNAESGKAA